MATPSFDLLKSKLLAWSNRDEETLGANPVLRAELQADFLRYAADKAYRQLRIPPLEVTYRYPAVGDGDDPDFPQGSTRLQVPVDLTEFIHLRTVDENGETVCIFNEKADIRTYHDMYADKYNQRYWSRQGSNILISPAASTGEIYELHYYRRLPALGSVYDITQENLDAGVVLHITRSDFDSQEQYDAFLPINDDDNLEITSDNTGVYTGPDGPITEGILVPTEVPNWLMQQNERTLLFGGLAEMFYYLADMEEAQKYSTLFGQEINELNVEETMRRASGGNVQVNFNGYGLL